MPTVAPRHDGATLLRELDERTQIAWAAYRDSLRDLSGRDYDEAECRSWERLQRKLAQLDEQRAELAGEARFRRRSS